MHLVTDPIEKIIETALNSKKVKFNTHPNDTKRLDFYLPEFAVYIECKAHHSPRISEQMSRVDNIIVIQGKKAALCFAELLRG